MKIKYIPIAILAMLLALPAVSFAVDACSQIWQIGSSMPTARYRPQGAVVDDIFYVFGGMDGISTYFDSVEAYDYWTNTWTTRTAMPQSFSNHCVAAWDGIIYVAGGFDSICHDYFYAYDPAADTWDTSLSQLSVDSCGASCAALDGKFYMAGGNAGSTATDALNIYDIATDTWSPGAVMPAAFSYGHGAIVDGDFVVAGGYQNLTGTYIYDIATGNWSTSTPMNLGRQSGAIANVHTPSGSDFLFIMGGGDGWTPTDDLQQFQTIWSIFPGYEMPADRFAQAGGNIGAAVLFSAGGAATLGAPESDLYIFNLCGCYIQSVSPTFAPAGVATVVDFQGIHFDDNTDFWLDDGAKATYPLTDLVITSSTVAQGKIPTDAPSGMYELWGDNTVAGPQFMDMVEYQLCDCVIDDVCYNDGDLNPANNCEICDPAATAIAWSSNEGETCDDGLWCTENDQCTAGACDGAPRDCDDGAFCTGVESCNDGTDACDSSGDPCDADESCNEDTDACDASGDDDDDDSADDDDAADDDDSGDDDDDSGGGCCG